MYIILNQSAGMSTGKAAAQASHAAVEAYRVTLGARAHQPCTQHDLEPNIMRRWYRGGHYTKIVLGADGEEALHNAQHYLEARGFKTALIVDEGRTEVKTLTTTALGVEIVDKDDPHVQDTFSVFPLYRDHPVPLDVRAAENYARASGWVPSNERSTRRLPDWLRKSS